MPLYIKDDGTAALVAELARRRGVSKQEAVRLAVQAELQRIAEAIPLRERIAAWRKEHPMPPATHLKADKAFFDELSGEH
jgi:antitoxin VapB